MKASDVMASPVITVKPQDTVKDVARLFLQRGISAAPVVDDKGRLVGIVSEGDLVHRAEIGTEKQRSRWLEIFVGKDVLAAEYVKSHAGKVADLMTRDVITAPADAPLGEVAMIMEKRAVKRVPILRDGQLVGIVSRSNLVQAIAAGAAKLDIPLSDSGIRNKLLAHLKSQGWADTNLINPTVRDGIVDLWGVVDTAAERTAIRVAAETMPDVRAVNDHLILRPPGV